MTTEKLKAAFLELVEQDTVEALGAATEMFVRLVLAVVESKGEDPKKKITIKSVARSITIHETDK